MLLRNSSVPAVTLTPRLRGVTLFERHSYDFHRIDPVPAEQVSEVLQVANVRTVIDPLMALPFRELTDRAR
ncbi:hypothetical protein [Nocardia sp. NPDC052316]|uniref:hypothetical protein n=1 Tax=Nocardia sp. NPDC052316 TaxID=3364329 RepID=UPI0037CB86E8